MDQCGIRASSIGSPVGKLRLDQDFDAHMALLRRVITIAKRLQCRYIRIFSFYPAEKGWNEAAKQENVVLLHENEKDVYGDTAEHCRELLEAFGGSHFRAVFAPANFVQCGVDTKYAFDLLQQYVGYLHIKDACACNGRVVPAGHGDGNIPYILGRLMANGYDGFISLEPHLGSFEGLAELELGDEMLHLPKSGEGTFTIAYHALKDILQVL